MATWRPFVGERFWTTEQQEALEALWAWHSGLMKPASTGVDYEAEASRASAGEPLGVLPAPVVAAAYEAARQHDLPLELLAEQVRAAEAFAGPIRLADGVDLASFIDRWAAPHGRLVARLAGVTGGWQQRWVDELSRGFFLVGRLMYLSDDLARDWCFVPLSEMEQGGVSVEQLREGRLDDGLRKVLWKQNIRARDALAQGQALVDELPRRQASAVKRWWMGALEVLHTVDRRGYDVWSTPVELSNLQRLRVRLQARFGRTTFRGR